MIDWTDIEGGDTWEMLARDFLSELGLVIDIGPGRGADAGRDMIAYRYAANLGAYSPDSLQFGRMVAQEDGTGLVQTWVRRPMDGETVSVEWRIGGGDDDGFKVIDVMIDGVSVVRTLRADFATIVASGGMPKLLSALRRQVEALKSPPRGPAPPPRRTPTRDPNDLGEVARTAPARRASA